MKIAILAMCIACCCHLASAGVEKYQEEEFERTYRERYGRCSCLAPEKVVLDSDTLLEETLRVYNADIIPHVVTVRRCSPSLGCCKRYFNCGPAAVKNVTLTFEVHYDEEKKYYKTINVEEHEKCICKKDA